MLKRLCVYGTVWLYACSLAAFADVSPALPQEQAAPVLFPVCVTVFDNRCGLLDRSGHWAVEPHYGPLYASDDNWIANTPAGREGVLDAQGHPLIPPRFQTIGRSNNGLAPSR